MLVVVVVFTAVTGWSDKRLARADQLASVGGLMIGVAALLISALALWVTVRHDEQKSRSAEIDEAVRLDNAASKLADAVRSQWTYEAELRQLWRPQPLWLRWSTTHRPVSAQPAVVLGASVPGRPTRLKLRGDLHDVVAAFEQLPARQLVVLGEPGAGKTVLAMLFTLGLLKTRTPGEPVPVLLPISSWNPSAEHLHTWLARRLVEDYPALANTHAYGPDAAARLVHARQLIPVLDGLDEMPPTLRAAALEALDQAVTDGAPLVVTCRGTEYQSAVTTSGRFLSRAAVVEIEPVDVADSIEFLTAGQTAGDTRWQPVFDQLRTCPGGPLAQALSTPLMVYLTRVAYTDPTTSPAELCDPHRFSKRVAVEEHLLNAYLPSVYSHHPTPLPAPDHPSAGILRPYPLDQARQWLILIASHLHHQQTPDLAWWKLHLALPHRAKRWVGGLAFGLIYGLICAIAVGISLGFSGVVAGFMGGLTTGLMIALLTGPPAHPRQVKTQLHGRAQQLWKDIVAYGVTGLGVGITIGTVAGLAIGLTAGITTGVTCGIAVGFFGGLVQWLNAPADEIRSPAPISVLRNDRTGSAMQAFFGVFGIAFTVGFVAALSGIKITPAVGIVGGLAGGLVAGFVLGLASRFAVGRFSPGLVASAWGWHLVSRCWLALAHKSPWRLMTFLDDAHQRGVLRQAGAVYQFRHAILKEILSRRCEFRSSES